MRNIPIITFIVLLFSSCQTTQYYSAVALQKEERQLLLAFDSQNSHHLANKFKSGVKTGKSGEWLLYSIPITPTVHYNWGSKHSIDHCIGYGIQKGLSYALKWQILGTQTTKFACAIRPQVGLQPFASNVKAVEQQFWTSLPVFATIKLKNNSSFTFNFTRHIGSVGYLNYSSQPQKYFQHHINSFGFNFNSKRNWVFAWQLTSTDDFSARTQISIGKFFRFPNSNTE